MKGVRKFCFWLMLVLFPVKPVFSQEVRVDTIVDSKFIYWEDGSDENSKVLTKSLFKDNWFFGMHVGGVYNWGTNSSHASVLGQVQPIGGLSVGKRLSPYMSARLQTTLARNRGTIMDSHIHHRWWAFAAYGDVLFDLTNLSKGFIENRQFNFIGLIGLGTERTFWYKKLNPRQHPYRVQISDWYLGLRIGLMTRFHLSEVWDFTLEATNSWLNNAYDGVYGSNTYDPHINVMAGFVYRFRNHDGSRDFHFARRNRDKFQVLNDEINRLRKNALDAKEFAEAHPNITIVNSQQVNTLISFAENSDEIDELQQVNVYTTAEAMKRLENADLYITVLGHETRNVDLFLRRAESIRTSLVNDYRIPAGKIYMERNPAVVEALDKAVNCVILYINE